LQTSRRRRSAEVGFLNSDAVVRCKRHWRRREVAVYCEHCGLKILPERPICTRCGKSPSQEWIQLTSLAVLLLAAIANSITGWLLLPKVVATHPTGFFFRGWLWADRATGLYGWMPLAAAMLAWEFHVWRKVRKAKPIAKARSWVNRKILTFVLAAGFAPIL